MIPDEVRDLVKSLVDAKVTATITDLKKRVEQLETEIKILKEGVNL